jgi:hypothetical protein
LTFWGIGLVSDLTGAFFFSSTFGAAFFVGGVGMTFFFPSLEGAFSAFASFFELLLFAGYFWVGLFCFD